MIRELQWLGPSSWNILGRKDGSVRTVIMVRVVRDVFWVRMVRAIQSR